MKVDQDKIQKELEKSHQKKRDKIKDIEILNNKIDELQSQFKTINKKETTLKSKVVTLETDNDHYLNKIHQYEEEVTDLKERLENTMENLITTQNDFEEYKIKKEEELQRLKQKLQEEKGNVKALMNKNKINKYWSNIIVTNKNDDDEDIKGEDKRKLSWSEKSYSRLNTTKSERDKENINNKNKNEENKQDKYGKELDNMLESGEGRFGRAMTIQKTRYNFGDILSKIRKRREELVIFNKKIKREHSKFISN